VAAATSAQARAAPKEVAPRPPAAELLRHHLDNLEEKLTLPLARILLEEVLVEGNRPRDESEYLPSSGRHAPPRPGAPRPRTGQVTAAVVCSEGGGAGERGAPPRWGTAPLRARVTHFGAEYDPRRREHRRVAAGDAFARVCSYVIYFLSCMSRMITISTAGRDALRRRFDERSPVRAARWRPAVNEASRLFF